jgi:hypothetical protein
MPLPESEKSPNNQDKKECDIKQQHTYQVELKS